MSPTVRPVRRRFVLLLPPLAAAVTGCARLAPVETVERAAFVDGGTAEQRREQIRRAAEALGWRTEDTGLGMIRATLVLRAHTAVVDIPFDARGFEIRYLFSINLNHDGSSIHPTYNYWVRNLQRRILVESVA